MRILVGPVLLRGCYQGGVVLHEGSIHRAMIGVTRIAPCGLIEDLAAGGILRNEIECPATPRPVLYVRFVSHKVRRLELRLSAKEGVVAHAPQFDVRVIQGTGHFLMLDKPTEFASTLREVVESIESGKAKRRPT